MYRCAVDGVCGRGDGCAAGRVCGCGDRFACMVMGVHASSLVHGCGDGCEVVVMGVGMVMGEQVG